MDRTSGERLRDLVPLALVLAGAVGTAALLTALPRSFGAAETLVWSIGVGAALELAVVGWIVYAAARRSSARGTAPRRTGRST